MSGDALCVGVCMIDWDAGVCLGCGRTADEINGVPAPAPGPNKIAPTTIGTSVSEIGTGPIRMPLATVCSTTTSAARMASEVRRTTDA